MTEPAAQMSILTVPAMRLVAAAERFATMGIDVERVLNGAGISTELMFEQRARVTTAQMERLLSALWQETGDEVFGLGSAPVPLGSFRLLAYGAHSAPTLGAQIRRLNSLQHSLAGFPRFALRAVEDPSRSPAAPAVRLSFDIDFDPHPVEILVDSLLVLVHGWLSWSVGDPLELTRVEVPYPPLEDAASHRRLFGAQVRYAARHPGLVFPAELLRLPTVRDEDEIARFVRHAPRHMLRRGGEPTVSAQVRTLMATAPHGSPPPSAERIASELAMSPQTLRRRLHEEGTPARAIREDLLRDLAVDGLTRGEPVHVLAHRLGFAEPSTFSRAFRRWTGSPPSVYQSEHSGGA